MTVNSLSLSPAWKKVAGDIAREGFSVFGRELFQDDDTVLTEARQAFIASCDELPADRHSKFSGKNRRYGRFLLRSDGSFLEPIPPLFNPETNEFESTYQQQSPFNPEYRGMPRDFSALIDTQSESLFLHDLIVRCFTALDWKWHGLVSSGVHIVQYSPKIGGCVTSSPSHIHRDGEPFTWAFLLDRVNVLGGENIICDISCSGKYPEQILSESIHARFTQKTSLEGWVVDDARVCHYVSPVLLDNGANSGHRTVLLVDFTPVLSTMTI
jgi:hypothetical protein